MTSFTVPTFPADSLTEISPVGRQGNTAQNNTQSSTPCSIPNTTQDGTQDNSHSNTRSTAQNSNQSRIHTNTEQSFQEQRSTQNTASLDQNSTQDSIVIDDQDTIHCEAQLGETSQGQNELELKKTHEAEKPEHDFGVTMETELGSEVSSDIWGVHVISE